MSRAPFTLPRRLFVTNWLLLKAHHHVSKCCYNWVSDESIAKALADLQFDPPNVPHTPSTNRANRIASIVYLMQSGVVFDPLIVDVTRWRVHLRDGHHRLRAYEYLNKLDSIPIMVAGCYRRIYHTKADK